MIASFIDIAVNYPEVIKRILTKENEKDNELTIKLQIDGQERTFKIDTFLPVRPGIDTYSYNLIWMQFLEKAFAKVYGAYSVLG